MRYTDLSEELGAKQIDHKSGPEESDAAVNRPKDGAEHKKNGYKCDKKTCSDQPPNEPEDFLKNIGNDLITIVYNSLRHEYKNRE